MLRKQSDDIDDAFDGLCNVLSILGTDYIRAGMINSDLIAELLAQEEIPFKAVFDLMNRLNIYGICVKHSSLPAIDEKEVEAIRVHGDEGKLCITCNIVQAGNGVATFTFFVPYWIYLTKLEKLMIKRQFNI